MSISKKQRERAKILTKLERKIEEDKRKILELKNKPKKQSKRKPGTSLFEF